MCIWWSVIPHLCAFYRDHKKHAVSTLVGTFVKLPADKDILQLFFASVQLYGHHHTSYMLARHSDQSHCADIYPEKPSHPYKSGCASSLKSKAASNYYLRCRLTYVRENFKLLSIVQSYVRPKRITTIFNMATPLLPRKTYTIIYRTNARTALNYYLQCECTNVQEQQ